MSWIIASRFAAVHFICLRKLTFTLLRVTSAFLHFVQSAYAKSALSSLKLDYQPTSNCHDLVLLGKCLGFAPRSESFAIEPSVQVCSISSLSEFRFAEMSCFATPASASSIRTQIRYAQLTKFRFRPNWTIKYKWTSKLYTI